MKCNTIRRLVRTIGFLASLIGSSAAFAWGSAGHQTIGKLADQLLVGTHAGQQVKKILNSNLQAASVWADCVKGVSKSVAGFKYSVNPRFPECKPFETPAGQARMVDFVKRNWDPCHPAAGEDPCHKQYHYSDVAIERDIYRKTEIGTSDHDIVSAIVAAIAVLKGGTAPPPFSVANKREALRVLSHYVGDIHQPLHVSAVYLDASGHEVDPDTGAFDPNSKNRGGNQLIDGQKKLHGEWDAIATSLNAAHLGTTSAAKAKLVPTTTGAIESWPVTWATETLQVGKAAFKDLAFGAEDAAAHTWPVTLPPGYSSTRTQLQRNQLIKGGARLAQLLEAIFP